MIFFKKEELQYTKIDATLDLDIVKKLRTRIINDCSTIYFRTIESVNGPEIVDPLKIRNVRRGKFLHTQKNEMGQDEKVYEYTFFEYDYPKLVELVDEILAGNTSSLVKLLSEYEIESIPNFDEMVSNLAREVDSIDTIQSPKTKIDMLQNIYDLQLQAALNRNQISTKTYYDLLLGYITYDALAVKPVSEIDGSLDFLGINASEVKIPILDSTKSKEKENVAGEGFVMHPVDDYNN